MKQQLATLLATFFYSGLSPVAPGTAGSLAAIIVGMVLFPWLSPILLLIAGIIIYVIGVWASNVCMEKTGSHDPGAIVIDEVAGIAIAMLVAFPYMNSDTILNALISGSVVFVFFRFFDIIKPWPIGFIDRKVKGGHGVMLDDVLAGIFAGIFSYLVLYLLAKYG
jgi:phosphatidylglycerophosphatase A